MVEKLEKPQVAFLDMIENAYAAQEVVDEDFSENERVGMWARGEGAKCIELSNERKNS